MRPRCPDCGRVFPANKLVYFQVTRVCRSCYREREKELERKLLTSRGYLADVAVDGMDGWNAVRTGVYDLVITDVDMPRMDGIEFATLIKRDPHLKSLPVMIVSYKDREADRLRGLEAGADYYLTKGSFQDETLLQAVADLIGEPEL